MKVISKERTHVEKYNIYVANDGTEFNNEDECRKYDDSAEGVLNAMLRKIMVRQTTECGLLDYGSEDSTVEIYRPTSEDDKKTIMQMYIIKHSWLDDDKKLAHYVDEADELVDRAIKEDDFLFVNRGYDYDSFWLIGTVNSMREKLEKCCKKEEEKENA